MSTHYISTCHDCKETLMWDRVAEEQAKEWHKNIFNKEHKGHDTQFFGDYDSESWDRAHDDDYYDLGIQDDETYITIRQVIRKNNVLDVFINAMKGEGK
ncbi:hypothetical protein [Bacillus halotolerans]|uniref:hypothetical protein n=1 Tax=Bacillus halotolerans TaxID=260554 RepID=UPI002DBE9498|nr:hypothetical protein [Bacillus halotolerans]MEC3639789.1 hypothetical protein [Bacillus halotolerans]